MQLAHHSAFLLPGTKLEPHWCIGHNFFEAVAASPVRSRFAKSGLEFQQRLSETALLVEMRLEGHALLSNVMGDATDSNFMSAPRKFFIW